MKLLSLIMVGLSLSTSAFASQTIYPNNPDIMRLGRVGVSDSGYKVMNWSGSTIALNIKGSGFDIKLSPTTGTSKYTDMWYEVYVNDTLSKVVQLNTGSYASAFKVSSQTGYVTINLGADKNIDTSAINQVKIVQLNDAAIAPPPVRLEYILLKDGTTLQPASKFNYKLVYYGDSITSGLQDSNNDGGDPANDHYANISISYAFQTTQKLIASLKNYAVSIDPQYISLSGIALSNSPYWGGATMFNYYNQLAYGASNTLDSENANTVVINLGTNDIAGGATKAGYLNSLRTFVHLVRTLNPDAKIVLALWGMADPIVQHKDIYMAQQDLVREITGDSSYTCSVPATYDGNGNVVNSGVNPLDYRQNITCFYEGEDYWPYTGNAPGHPTKTFAGEHAARLSYYLTKLYLNSTN
ncbi:GDSL-type esterase/lipase family protein [Vibrio sp. S4M6]|uniref:GDSL-type esterase/lipase family protein n=1 Tax=Vibrio sinus TaxID=2946865 RepID=UPI00202A6B16|nr:GDSL-type esterase/lipase family protein [Vibrio sinus]MCL9780678.1 GDSL-type esterase/lipase family protein [Vibrio sinus]